MNSSTLTLLSVKNNKKRCRTFLSFSHIELFYYKGILFVQKSLRARSTNFPLYHTSSRIVAPHTDRLYARIHSFNYKQCDNPFTSSPNALFNGLLWYMMVSVLYSTFRIQYKIEKKLHFLTKKSAPHIISCNMSVGKWDIISTYIWIAFVWCIKPLLSPIF